MFVHLLEYKVRTKLERVSNVCDGHSPLLLERSIAGCGLLASDRTVNKTFIGFGLYFSRLNLSLYQVMHTIHLAQPVLHSAFRLMIK